MPTLPLSWPPRPQLRGRTIAQAILLLVWAVIAVVSPATAQIGDVTIAITNPKNEETIHDNTGKVAVTIAIENGDIASTAGIQVLIDGQPYGPPQHSASFVLENIMRGEHTLQARLMDVQGNVIASSAGVKFYMWQASALFPSRKGRK